MNSLALIGLAALAIGVFIRALDSNIVPFDVPPRLKPFLVLVLGCVLSVLLPRFGGLSWEASIAAGLGAAGIATLGRNLITKSIMGDVAAAKKSPSIPPLAGAMFALVLLIGACTKQQTQVVEKGFLDVTNCVLNDALAGVEPVTSIEHCAVKDASDLAAIVEAFLAKAPPANDAGLQASPRLEPFRIYLAKAKALAGPK